MYSKEEAEAEMQVFVDDFYPELVARVSKYAPKSAKYETPRVKVADGRLSKAHERVEESVTVQWKAGGRQGTREEVAKRVLGDLYPLWAESRDMLKDNEKGRAKRHENEIIVLVNATYGEIVHELLHKLRAQTVPYNEVYEKNSDFSSKYNPVNPRANISEDGFDVIVPPLTAEFFSEMWEIAVRDILGENNEVMKEKNKYSSDPKYWAEAIRREPEGESYFTAQYAINGIESNYRRIKGNWQRVFAMSPQGTEWRFLLEAQSRLEAVISGRPLQTRLKYFGRKLLAFCQDSFCDYYTRKVRRKSFF